MSKLHAGTVNSSLEMHQHESRIVSLQLNLADDTVGDEEFEELQLKGMMSAQAIVRCSDRIAELGVDAPRAGEN